MSSTTDRSAGTPPPAPPDTSGAPSDPGTAPGTPVVLLLEDDPADALLVEHTLEQQVPEARIETVASREEFLERLEAGGIDLVLSDGSVTGCEGLEAFHAARAHDPHLSFLYLSGFDDPHRDMRGLRGLGISDFLSKSRLDGLGPAVRAALAARTGPTADQPALLAGYAHLVGTVRELSLARDLPTVVAIARRAARALTGAEGATFVIREGDECYVADEDAIAPLWKGQRFHLDASVSGWAIKNRQPAVVENTAVDPRVPAAAYEQTFVRSVIMAPIRAADPVGTLGAYWSQPRVPDDGEVHLLQALADTTAVAMENVAVYQELETRVQERTAELEAFTYAVSHDLRAPLRHMQGFASILLENRNGTLDENDLRWLRRIAASSDTMREMIDGLLELSRTTQAPLHRVPVDLAALSREVAAECADACDHEVRFTAPESAIVSGDPRLLRGMLQNLLDNAWKFTGRTADPAVELAVVRNGRERVFEIRDNGAGFEPSGAERLFRVFQRLHSQDDFAGIGVGLASVQRVVRRHGGRIWATGRPGEGATFSFTLPG